MKLAVAVVVVLACVATAHARLGLEAPSGRLATPELNHCNLLKNETACDASSPAGSCVWCACKAIPSGCFTPAQAAKLPPGVFECQKPAVEVEPMFSWNSCSKAGALMSNVNVAVSPNPPVAGQDLTVSVTGSLSSAVSSGTLDFSVSILGINLLKKTLNICTDLGVSCPLSGNVDFKLTQSIPGDAPTGTYTLNANAVTSSGQQIACFDASLQL